MTLLASANPTSRYDCVVIDDDPDICRLISHVLSGIGVSSLGLHSASALKDALTMTRPSVVFLDVALGHWDAIDGIRMLEQIGFGGAVQLISGKDPELVDAIKAIGDRHGLKMLDPIQKPFRFDHLRRVFEDQAGDTEAGGSASQATVAPDSGRRQPLPRVDLAEALEAQWLDIHYQPKVDLVRNIVVGAEGLARLNHPVHGLLGPGSFLPDADDARLRDLAEFAIRKAFADWEILAEAGRNFKLSVNAPVKALLDPSLADVIRDSPRSKDWPGIIIEVTEGEAVRELHSVAEAATQLRIYGVTLAIDDFGSGYSSFARLKQLPFSELKLDRSYVQDCANDPLNAGICRSIVDLARASGATSVAEGIETAHEWTALARMGCDVGQGFYFGRPMSVGKLIERVHADAN